MDPTQFQSTCVLLHHGPLSSLERPRLAREEEQQATPPGARPMVIVREVRPPDTKPPSAVVVLH